MNSKIYFDNNGFDAILCLNGEISHFDYIQENKGIIYCADGGANKLIDKEIIPDYIIGDLDSINVNEFKNKYSDIKLIEKESQETNDFEKCLDYLLKYKKKNILLFGMQGGELEHTLNNWSVLKKFAKKLNITILHNDRYAFVVSDNIEIELSEKELISLIPQPKCKLSTSGLKWNLNEEYLELGVREGARNLSVQKKVKIEVLEGELLVFVNSRYPQNLNFKQTK